MIELSFTAPPSTNNLFRNQGNIRYATKRYRMWQQTAGWEIKAQMDGWNGIGSEAGVVRRHTDLRKFPIDGPFALTIWLPPGLDIDNIKAIPDLLGPGKHGIAITEDDRQMVELHVYRDREAKQCRVRIEART